MRFEPQQIRKAFLCLAPVALGLAAWLLPAVDSRARFGLAMDSDLAVSLARDFAADQGIATEGWNSRVEVERQEGIERFLRLRQQSHRNAVEEIRRWAPPVSFRVLLDAIKGGSNLEVQLAPDGSPVAWDFRGLIDRGAEPTESSPEAVARRTLRDRLGGESDERWQLADGREAETGEASSDSSVASSESLPENPPESGDAEADTSEVSPEAAVEIPLEAAKPAASDWRYRDLAPLLPEVDLEPKLTVEGGRVVAFSVDASLKEGPDVPSLGRSDASIAIQIVAVFLLLGVSLISLFWGLWRYWSRLQESEVSHWRTLSIGLLVSVLAGLTLFYLLAGEGVMNLGEGPVEGAGASALAAVGVGLFLMPLGLVLGAVWSGCEGDVRQIFAVKLVSLDALLAGRWWSRNLGRAVLTGAACAAWVMLLWVVSLAPWSGRPEAGPDMMVGLFLRNHPWQFSLAQAAALLIPYSTLGLLAPLSLLRRWTRSRARTLPVLVAILWMTCILTPAASGHWPMSSSLVAAGVWTAAFLVPFFVFDFLTAAVSFMLSYFSLNALYFLHQPAEGLRESAMVAGSGLALVLVAAGLLWAFGREISVEEVRPGYARNILERMALSAEMTAAQQARARMLPQNPPQVEGALWTVASAPGADSEGDYFDFFPLERGDTAFVVADFGHHGLAAAQRLTLAKGFLTSYSRRGLTPQEVTLRLSQRLQELVLDPDEIRLAYGVYDPARSKVVLAVDRKAPVVLVYRSSPSKAEVPAGGQGPANVGTAADGSAAEGTGGDATTCDIPASDFEPCEVDLEAGDALALFLPGQPLTPREQSRLIVAVEKGAPTSAASFSAILRKRGLPSGTVIWLQRGVEA
ncbi:MAG: serine/threonine-protein phosphatase [Deltaproteobacteria bacterium]|nr:serine/threonine-protein phosphatase [Deltaproteobacteria bacterium]